MTLTFVCFQTRLCNFIFLMNCRSYFSRNNCLQKTKIKGMLYVGCIGFSPKEQPFLKVMLILCYEDK